MLGRRWGFEDGLAMGVLLRARVEMINNNNILVRNQSVDSSDLSKIRSQTLNEYMN